MDEQSKSKQIFIVRHGETEYNRKGMVQGRGIDAPLNELGRKQASAFYDHYHTQKFDHLYISELRRTYESVEEFILDGLPYTKLQGLDEISWGSQEGVKFSEHTLNEYQSTVDQWKAGELDVAVGGGESPRQVAARQKEAMQYILSQHQEEKILICMHGRAMRILVCWLLGYELSLMDEFPHHNLGLYQLVYTGSMFRLQKVNDTNHLKLAEL